LVETHMLTCCTNSWIHCTHTTHVCNSITIMHTYHTCTH